MRRLAIFGPLPPPHSGMETITHTLLSELDRLGPAAGLAYRHVDISVNRSQGGREVFRPGKLVRLLRQLARAARLAALRHDAYYPLSQNRNGLLRDVVLLLPFRLARRTVVLHLHGAALDQVLERQARWMRWIVRAVAGRPRTFGIVLTPSLRHCLEPLVRPDRITVVENAVQAPPGRMKPRDGTGTLDVLFLSTLMPSKGYRELVRAVSRLAASGVPVRLALAGELWAQEDGTWIGAYAADPAISYRGPVTGPAKWEALSRAHVLALPSVAPEGQPLAILEGMAAGCAILTTGRGGIPDTVGEPEGSVLEPLAGPALEAEIERVLRSWSEDRDAVRRAGEAARARYERDYSPERFIGLWRSALGAE